jgi:putative acetyltransferase
MRIRPERPEDREALRALLEAAFGRPAEADLVEALHAERAVVTSLVAVEAGLVGQVLISRLTADPPMRAGALAPLAVRPDRQRQGIGTALVRAALADCRAKAIEAVFVLGDAAYYGRFGFTREAARPFQCLYAGPYHQALALRPGALAGGGRLVYPRAFEGVD